MKRTLFAALAFFAFIGNVATAETSGLRSSSFDGHILFCATEGGLISEETLPDGTIIRKFFNIGNVWFTGNPLVDGVERNEVTATSVPNPPSLRLDITGFTDVDAVDGGWRFRQLIRIDSQGERGIGFGLGTGDLRGKLIIFRSGAGEEITNSPCAVPFGVPISGKVITFGWRW